MLDIDSIGRVILLEHSRLQGRTPGPKRIDESVHLRLHDKVDMCRSMRPEAHIDLGGTRETSDHGTGAMQQRSHLGRLVGRQVRHPYHVTRRFDQKGANAKRSDTVLNPPVLGVMDQTPGKIAASLGEVTCDAAGYVPHDARIAGAGWHAIRRVLEGGRGARRRQSQV